MKSNGKKIIIILSLGIIFMILNLYNYNFIDYQRNNNMYKQIPDDLHLKTANSEIFIITPENKTYTEPMSGYYPGTFGFENDKNDISPEGWIDNSGTNWIKVVSDRFGHNKVLEAYDTGDGGWHLSQFFNSPEGTIEFWWAISSTASNKFHQVGVFNSTGADLFGIQVSAGQIQVLTGMVWFDIPGLTTTANTWDHVRLDFRSSIGNPHEGLNPNEFRLIYNGVDQGIYSFNRIGNPNYTRLYSGWGTTDVYGYYDAFGYSWDPNYNIGDNLNEGLLLSFENNTNLDWIGYTLDGQANRTILGNKTIIFPDKGSHKIQVFGNDSLGNLYYSPIKYFEVILNLTGNPIYINGPADWINIALQPWCTGSGTWNDPYILEYIMIDGEKTDVCIEIRNSNVFFIIRHCFISNGVFAGIFLLSTTNGQLVKNNIFDCGGLYGGIYLYAGCSNLTISENTLNNNDWSGIHLEGASLSPCYNNTISGNLINNSAQYGITITGNSDSNKVSNNFLYFNNDGAIRIVTADCENNRIERNIIVSVDEKFINNVGTNTLLISNYYLTKIPSLFMQILEQSFSTSEFFIIFNVSSECFDLEISFLSIQMWWNGNIVSLDNITILGNGLYNVSLSPIFVEIGKDPILLNMTISAANHRDSYFELYLDVQPPEIVKFLQLEITESSYSTEHFNLTFFIFDENNQSVDSAIIQMWWNGTNISGDVINLGNGFYFISLEPITVTPGGNPILLTMIVSADGYDDKTFQTYIAVDPDILDKDLGRTTGELPLVLIITIITITSGIVLTVGIIYLLLKKKRIKEAV